MGTAAFIGTNGGNGGSRRGAWATTRPAKRITKRGSGRTKTEAKTKLKEVLRDYEDGLVPGSADYTVADAVREWLDFGLAGASGNTRTTNRIIGEKHIIPPLGARKLRELTADEVDKWLAGRAAVLSSSSLSKLHSALNRSVRRAMARD